MYYRPDNYYKRIAYSVAKTAVALAFIAAAAGGCSLLDMFKDDGKVSRRTPDEFGIEMKLFPPEKEDKVIEKNVQPEP